MDWNRVQGSWKQLEGKVKAKWGKLTDDDLTAINGRREELEGKIQQRYGIAKDQSPASRLMTGLLRKASNGLLDVQSQSPARFAPLRLLPLRLHRRSDLSADIISLYALAASQARPLVATARRSPKSGLPRCVAR